MGLYFLSLFFVLLGVLKIGCSTKFVEDLLTSMSLNEKIGQMTQIDISVFYDASTGDLDYDKLSYWISNYKIGSVLDSLFSGIVDINGKAGWTAKEWRQHIQAIQNIVAKETLSKIPMLYGIDSIHGATYTYGAALFPQAITIAASFNTDLPYQSSAISAKDTRAAGIPWIFAPVLGLGLNPLWSRFPETFGEDPHLAAQMGASTVVGMQAQVADGGFPQSVAACMKHFIAYSDPENGHDRSPVMLPDRILQELYRPSFQAAIDSGVMSAMESYQEVGGVPMASSKQYLKTLLRSPWNMNFTGMMVTDYAEIENLHSWHRIADSSKDAVRIAMQDTSIDMSMVPSDPNFITYLTELVNEGTVPESRVDESVRRILQMKEKLGLFATPVISIDDPLLSTVGQADDWEASLNAARESIALVKNDVNVLPVKNGAKIFLSGPTSNSLAAQTGGWSLHWQGAINDNQFTNGVTIKSAFESLVENENLMYAAGPAVDATDLSQMDMTSVLLQASTADVLVICIGEGNYAEKPGDIDDLSLPQGQLDYVNALYATGIPVVLVLISGRPRLLHGIADNAAGVVNAFVPGPMGGKAIAEIIVGNVVPSGRMPYSYPRSAGDMPYPYHRKTNDLCISPDNAYNFIPCKVEWGFGHGLSYTTFSYSSLSLSSSEIDEAGSVTVTVDVTNTGSLAAKHVVMLFLFDMYRSVTPEYKLLKGFTKVFLAPGEKRTVSFTLGAEDLKFVGVDSRYILEGGEFNVAIGDDVDCRTDPSNTMCSAFTLKLTQAYSPQCEMACQIWTGPRGVCGSRLSSNECSSRCSQENWGWNYVTYIESLVIDGCSVSSTNVKTSSLTSSSDSSTTLCQENSFGAKEISVTVGSVIGGMLLGFLATYLVIQHRSQTSKRAHGGSYLNDPLTLELNDNDEFNDNMHLLSSAP